MVAYKLKPGFKHTIWRDGKHTVLTDKHRLATVPNAFKDKFDLVDENLPKEVVIEEEVVVNADETDEDEVSIVKEGRKWFIYQGFELLTEEVFSTKREATEWLEENG